MPPQYGSSETFVAPNASVGDLVNLMTAVIVDPRKGFVVRMRGYCFRVTRLLEQASLFITKLAETNLLN